MENAEMCTAVCHIGAYERRSHGFAAHKFLAIYSATKFVYGLIECCTKSTQTAFTFIRSL